jgi:acetate kinase
MNILTINAGSSSIKYKVFNAKMEVMLSGLLSGIGEDKSEFKNHEVAFDALVQILETNLKDHPINGVGHRVVHGGNIFFKPTLITPEVLKKIKELANLAPIHNPVNALGIEFSLKHYPKAVQVAVFDTGFHHQMPEKARLYAINQAVTEKYDIRRYGFHGINHEYVAIQAAAYLNKPLSACNFISLHLGNGASSCLIKNGKSADTSMGMTPLAGLVMGSRCGDIDPAIPLYLLNQNFSAQEIDSLLNKDSGFVGIAQENDMRKLLLRAEAQDLKAKLAIDMYVYSIQKIIGAYLSQLPNLDALIFTAGIGENSATIRQKIMEPLQHLGFYLQQEKNLQKSDKSCWDISKNGKPILVIHGDEELMIAKDVIDLAKNLQ